MIALEKSPTRCHSYDVSEVKRYKKPVQRIEMSCACGPHKVTTIKYNRILNGVTYRCVSCKQPLKRR